MNFKVLCASVVIVLVEALSGCGTGKRPFLIAQVCLRNDQDVAAFEREMSSIAGVEGARFIDGSANTQKGLEAIDNPHVNKILMSRPLVNIGFDIGEGVGVTAGNLGMPGYQVALGFSEGSNSTNAHRLANAVVGKLAEHWRVETQSGNTGAKGMKDCN